MPKKAIITIDIEKQTIESIQDETGKSWAPETSSDPFNKPVTLKPYSVAWEPGVEMKAFPLIMFTNPCTYIWDGHNWIKICV